MTDPVSITVGKRLIPLNHIALVEPFDPASHPGMKTDKAFKARIVLVDRQSVLTEDSVEAFAQAHGFRFLAGEGVATNPALRFSVETFTPAEGFAPSKPFRTRLSWTDGDGERQSKLLLSDPHDVLAAVVTSGEGPGPDAPTMARMKPSGSRSKRPTAASDRRKARRQPPPEPAPF